MELGFFHDGCLPVTPEEELREATFSLLYGGSKLSKADVEELTAEERNWWLRRLAKQKEEEEAAIEKAKQEAKNKK